MSCHLLFFLGNFYKTSYVDRSCTCRQGSFETIVHAFLHCPFYDEIRQKHLVPILWTRLGLSDGANMAYYCSVILCNGVFLTASRQCLLCYRVWTPVKGLVYVAKFASDYSWHWILLKLTFLYESGGLCSGKHSRNFKRSKNEFQNN